MTIIDKNTQITQNFIDTVPPPYIIYKPNQLLGETLYITIEENLVITNPETCFVLKNVQNAVLDGNFHKITLKNVKNYAGLVVRSEEEPIFDKFTIQKFEFDVSSSTLKKALSKEEGVGFILGNNFRPKSFPSQFGELIILNINILAGEISDYNAVIAGANLLRSRIQDSQILANLSGKYSSGVCASFGEGVIISNIIINGIASGYGSAGVIGSDSEFITISKIVSTMDLTGDYSTSFVGENSNLVFLITSISLGDSLNPTSSVISGKNSQVFFEFIGSQGIVSGNQISPFPINENTHGSSTYFSGTFKSLGSQDSPFISGIYSSNGNWNNQSAGKTLNSQSWVEFPTNFQFQNKAIISAESTFYSPQVIPISNLICNTVETQKAYFQLSPAIVKTAVIDQQSKYGKFSLDKEKALLIYTPSKLPKNIKKVKEDGVIKFVKPPTDNTEIVEEEILYLSSFVYCYSINYFYSEEWAFKQTISNLYQTYKDKLINFNYCTSKSILKEYYGKRVGNKIYDYLFYNVVKTDCTTFIYNLVPELDEITKKYLICQVKKIINKKYTVKNYERYENIVIYNIIY